MTPEVTIRAGAVRYRGPVDRGSVHRHAAFQLVVAPTGEVAVEDASGAVHRGTALVVPPMTRHRTLPCTDLVTFFVEPQSALADRWRRAPGITDAGDTNTLGGLDEHLVSDRPSASLDERLVAAMTMLRTHGLPIRDVAARVGLSPARLRALAHDQLGMPLARWRAWARLTRAAELAAAGTPLADAATTAGFADQAHLTRWSREMTGHGPGVLLPALRIPERTAQGRRAT